MTIRLKELPAVLARNYVANVNTFIHGKPGIGKTETINAFADRMRQRIGERFNLWTFYAPTMSPMDIQASAPDAVTGLLRIYNNAALPNAYTHPDIEGAIFLGELPNTDPATAKLLQKYINGEDMSGCLRKPAGVRIIADGNRISDKSGVQHQGRAFLSRFAHLEVYSTTEDNMEYAAAQNWHPYIQTFFANHVALIDNYDEVFGTGASKNNQGAVSAEEAKAGYWANMRAWERVNRLEQVAEAGGMQLMMEEIAGNVGTAVAAQYDAHKKMLGSLATFDEIVAHPDTAKLPETLSENHALAMLVALRCNADQLGQVHTYSRRLAPETQVIVLKTLVGRKDLKLTSSKHYVAWVSDPAISSLLNGR